MKRFFDLNSVLSMCFFGFIFTGFIQFIFYSFGYSSASNFLLYAVNSYQVYLPQSIKPDIFLEAVTLHGLQFFAIYLAFKFTLNINYTSHFKKIKRKISAKFITRLYFLTIFFIILIPLNYFAQIQIFTHYINVIIQFFFYIYLFLHLNKIKFNKRYFYITTITLIFLLVLGFAENLGRGTVLNLLLSVLLIFKYSEIKITVSNFFYSVVILLASSIYMTSIKFSTTENIISFGIDQLFSRINLTQSTYWVIESPELFSLYDDSLDRLLNFIIPFYDFVKRDINTYNLNEYAFQLAYGGNLVNKSDISGGYAFSPIAETMINFNSIGLGLLFIFFYYMLAAFYMKVIIRLSPIVFIGLIPFLISGILMPENLIYICLLYTSDAADE